MREAHFDECPRCGAMADALVTSDGELFAIDCRSCCLRASSAVTIWNESHRYRLPLSGGITSVSDAVDFLLTLKVDEFDYSIWEGDVKVASVVHKLGVLYHAGRCHVV